MAPASPRTLPLVRKNLIPHPGLPGLLLPMAVASFTRVHLIAVGGSVMHNLALALHAQGLQVTGSDDEIFEPARARLAAVGLLPDREGWDENRIAPAVEAVIVGMHARADNPELLRAQALGVPVFSFPEFVYEQSRHKQRIVIGGSHGKTSITAMILHVLRENKRQFDYLVGAQLAGFERMVQLSDAPVIIIEGDEYLASPLDPRPKFHLYHHHIGVISGIEWDHINVFPTEENYKHQFRVFAAQTPKSGVLIYDRDDEAAQEVCVPSNPDVTYIGYSAHEHVVRDGVTYLITKKDEEVPLRIFGEHNLRNVSAAREVCRQLGIKGRDFYDALRTFNGAARRLELLAEMPTARVYRDFAHAPSKVRATTKAARDQFPKRRLVAVLELHTFSSLNPAFLPQYAGALDGADEAVVYFNPHVLAHKRLPDLNPAQVQQAFARPDVRVLTSRAEVEAYLRTHVPLQNTTLLLMSSGTFDGMKVAEVLSEG